MPLTPEQSKRVRDMYDRQIAKDAAYVERYLVEQIARKTLWQRIKAWFR